MKRSMSTQQHKMVVTRSLFKSNVRAIFHQLPDEIVMEILAHLQDKDLGVALCSSKRFFACKEHIWKAACARRWPAWFAVAEGSEVPWRRGYELLSLRERELLAVPSLPAIEKMQTVVNARNRAVLTEWLAEVSWDWQLESTIVFKAVSYLDNYLMHHNIAELSKFQLVGIGCLRAAMADVPTTTPEKAEEGRKALDPSKFAYISDRTYTAQEVEHMTAVVQRFTSADVRTAPNAKMFLRSYWYRSVQAGTMCGDEMHIYTLASFFLQLSLLDLKCSSQASSLLAAACLANALEVYGKPVWPTVLQHYSAYNLEELHPMRLRLRAVQEGSSAEHIRNLWRLHHEHHSYTEYTQEWATCLQLIACPCPAPKLKGNGSATSSSTSSGGNSSASAQTIAHV